MYILHLALEKQAWALYSCKHKTQRSWTIQKRVDSSISLTPGTGPLLPDPASRLAGTSQQIVTLTTGDAYIQLHEHYNNIHAQLDRSSILNSKYRIHQVRSVDNPPESTGPNM